MANLTFPFLEVTVDKLLEMGEQASPIMHTVSDDGIRKVTAAVDVLEAKKSERLFSALNRARVGCVMPGSWLLNDGIAFFMFVVISLWVLI